MHRQALALYCDRCASEFVWINESPFPLIGGTVAAAIEAAAAALDWELRACGHLACANCADRRCPEHRA